MKREWMGVLAFGSLLLAGIVVPLSIAQETVLLEENFDELTLGPSIQEALAKDGVWTNVPPEGWKIENDIPKNGMPEWEGWAFADAVWWTQMAEDQERSKFTMANDAKANAVIAVADPDEWDDAGPQAPGPYNTWLSTPPIPIGNILKENAITLTFDSSWRPEDTQKANLTVSFDAGEAIEILRFESVGAQTRYLEPVAGVEEMKPDLAQVNETITLTIPNPRNAKLMVITWSVFDATNDWWWAIDNIKVTTSAYAVSAGGKLATLWASVKGLP